MLDKLHVTFKDDFPTQFSKRSPDGSNVRVWSVWFTGRQGDGADDNMPVLFPAERGHHGGGPLHLSLLRGLCPRTLVDN